MKITYDKSADAMYIRLNEKAAYDTSRKVTDNVLVDYSESGEVVGVEILDASKNTLLPVAKSIPIEFRPASA